MTLLDEILDEVLCDEGLVGRDHVTGVGNYNRREVTVVAIPASNIVMAGELVIVAIYFTWLQVKHLTVREFDLFDPLEGAAHSILHIVVAHVDQDCEAA